MNPSSARGLVKITCYLLVVLAIAFTLLIAFLSQLDLNNYRLSLERTISTALKQPVQIGHSSLAFNHGLALSLKNLQIGDPLAPWADIPQITATLKLMPLFKGRFILSQVQIDNPNFEIMLPFPERPAKGASQNLFNTLGINILNVHNATIKLRYIQEGETEQQLALSHLHAVLRGWKPENSGELVVSGHLQEQGGRFLLEARLPSSRNPEIWRNEEHKAELKITNFFTSKLPEYHNQPLPELLDLTLQLQGAPATGASLNAVLSDPNSNESIASLSGLWTSSSEQDSFAEITGEILKIPLAGKIHFIHQLEKYVLTGQLRAEPVTLTPEILKAWQIPNANKLLRGKLNQLSVTIENSWDPTEQLSIRPHIGAEITISNLDWNIPGWQQFQHLSIGASLKNEDLQLKNGTLVFDNQHIDFSGKISSLFRQPQVDLQFSCSPDINEVLSLLQLPKSWSLSGNIPSSLRLTGSLIKPDFLLQSDLSSLNLQFGSLFHKQQTDRSQFKLQGKLENRQLQLNRLSLNLNDARIAGKGYILFDKHKREFSFVADPINLDKIRSFSPLLEQLQLQGVIEPELIQQGMGLQGILKLKDVGAHLTSVIADLNKTTGKIYFDRHGFTFENLKTSLGESNFTVDGIFSDWKNPEIELDLNSTKVRAHDIIFSNQQLTLHDLNGHLKIDADSISFTPVNVRLEDNTLATVNGTVSNFSSPQVSLDIQADRVDVLDIINLFVDPNPISFEKKNDERRNNGFKVLIKASAKQGTLGGLQFQNAEGIIRTNGKRLTIFPLTFNNGQGWCETRVEFDHREETAPLKVSGHVKGVNASILHQDIFKRPGLINGNLDGDFYLEGNPTDNLFWQKARGGAHIQVSNGTLKKFHGLAKVFSLLNVSQIFSGKLPDMDKEGMPFTLMEGSVQIGAGQIKTDNLKITSEAMNLSMVGTQGLIDGMLNFNLGVMPLRTVDKIITSIPIAGWVLAGENKALITAHFKIEGPSEDPKITAVPIDSVSNTVFGIVKRTFGLPGKLVKDLETMLEHKPKKKSEP